VIENTNKYERKEVVEGIFIKRESGLFDINLVELSRISNNNEELSEVLSSFIKDYGIASIKSAKAYRFFIENYLGAGEYEHLSIVMDVHGKFIKLITCCIDSKYNTHPISVSSYSKELVFQMSTML
jgi:hypothetical protein